MAKSDNLEIAPKSDDYEFLHTFMTVMEKKNTSSAAGICWIKKMPEKDISTNPNVLEEWNYWKEGAIEIAVMNMRDEESEDTIKKILISHFLTENELATPKSNVAQGLMKFTSLQLRSAYFTLKGLPPKNKLDGRTFNKIEDALDEVLRLNDKKELEIDRMWFDFMYEVAEEIGFNIDEILGARSISNKNLISEVHSG